MIALRCSSSARCSGVRREASKTPTGVARAMAAVAVVPPWRGAVGAHAGSRGSSPAPGARTGSPTVCAGRSLHGAWSRPVRPIRGVGRRRQTGSGAGQRRIPGAWPGRRSVVWRRRPCRRRSRRGRPRPVGPRPPAARSHSNRIPAASSWPGRLGRRLVSIGWRRHRGVLRARTIFLGSQRGEGQFDGPAFTVLDRLAYLVPGFFETLVAGSEDAIGEPGPNANELPELRPSDANPPGNVSDVAARRDQRVVNSVDG